MQIRKINYSDNDAIANIIIWINIVGNFLCVYIWGEFFVCVNVGIFLCAKSDRKTHLKTFSRYRPAKSPKTREKLKLYDFLLYNGETYFKVKVEIETAYYRRNTTRFQKMQCLQGV